MQLIENETDKVVESYYNMKMWRDTFAFVCVLLVMIVIFQANENYKFKKIAHEKFERDLKTVESYKSMVYETR